MSNQEQTEQKRAGLSPRHNHDYKAYFSEVQKSLKNVAMSEAEFTTYQDFLTENKVEIFREPIELDPRGTTILATYTAYRQYYVEITGLWSPYDTRIEVPANDSDSRVWKPAEGDSSATLHGKRKWCAIVSWDGDDMYPAGAFAYPGHRTVVPGASPNAPHPWRNIYITMNDDDHSDNSRHTNPQLRMRAQIIGA